MAVTKLVRQELDFGNEGSLSYLEWTDGGGRIPLHFAHANGFNSLTYRTLLSPLASRFHIRAWDARGHGHSTLPAAPENLHDWKIYRDDMIHFVERFADETAQAVVLAGHSMGATISLMVAAERPDLVRGVCLLEPVIGTQNYLSRVRFLNMLGLGSSNELARMAAQRRSAFPDRPSMIRACSGRGVFRTWPDDMIADYVEGGTRLDERGHAHLSCSPAWEAASLLAQGHDVWRALRNLRVPITLIYAGNGTTCHPVAQMRLGEIDPEATILRLGYATHFLPMECPDIVRREMLALTIRING
ncbi:MAG: alpha/beta hydrolase [Parvibaculaceae bacterium]|nr:alpha/beta hydrolase [Parvibaculaceae bacterium]